MKKIEDAAWESGNKHAPGSDNYISGFEAGASHVLEALTSDEAIELLAAEFDADGGLTGEARRRAAFVLAAVRKEIEGE